MDEQLKQARRLTYALYGADETFFLKTKQINVSYAELCLLYVLDGDKQYSQKEISQTQFLPATTVNTIIKKWEREGLVEQIPIDGRRREKALKLTTEGKEYAEKTLHLLYSAELFALSKTTEKFSADFIDALEYYGSCLQKFFTEECPDDEEADKQDNQ